MSPTNIEICLKAVHKPETLLLLQGDMGPAGPVGRKGPQVY